MTLTNIVSCFDQLYNNSQHSTSEVWALTKPSSQHPAVTETTNVTGRHRGRQSFFAYWTSSSSVTYTSYFSWSSVASRALTALCVYSTYGHHPQPLGYLCAKFRFCHALHCWASTHRKTAHSVNQSINQSSSLFDAPGTEALASEHQPNNRALFDALLYAAPSLAPSQYRLTIES